MSSSSASSSSRISPIASFMPLKNMTKNWREVIRSAAEVDLSSLLPPNIDPTILAGYEAQSHLLLELYRSTHSAVEEVAWEGSDTISLAMIREQTLRRS